MSRRDMANQNLQVWSAKLNRTAFEWKCTVIKQNSFIKTLIWKKNLHILVDVLFEQKTKEKKTFLTKQTGPISNVKMFLWGKQDELKQTLKI